MSGIPGAQNLEQARQVEVFWSEYVQGFVHAPRVMTNLFPLAGVPSRKGSVLKFGRDSFRLSQNKRAPGAPMRTRRFTHGKVSYLLNDHGETLLIPIEESEEAAAALGTSIIMDHMDQFMEVQTLRHEKDCADLALTSANYASGHVIDVTADQWDEADADPVSQMRDAKELVAKKIGRMPNTLVLGVDAYNAACDSPRIRDQVKYTSRESINENVLAAIFEVDRVVVARSVYDTVAGVSTYVFTSTSAVLAYVDPGLAAGSPAGAPEQPGGGASVVAKPGGLGSITSPAGTTRKYSMRRPSYGYTYVLNGYPTIDGQFWDADRRSWKFPFAWAYEPFQTMVDDADKVIAGVLLENIV